MTVGHDGADMGGMILRSTQVLMPGRRVDEGFWLSLDWQGSGDRCFTLSIDLPNANAAPDIWRVHVIPGILPARIGRRRSPSVQWSDPMIRTVYQATVDLRLQQELIGVRCDGVTALDPEEASSGGGSRLIIEETFPAGPRSNSGIMEHGG